MPVFLEWSTHGNTQSLRLIAAGNDAPVVVGENHYRHSIQCGVEDPLARAEEDVAVNESQPGHILDLHDTFQF